MLNHNDDVTGILSLENHALAAAFNKRMPRTKIMHTDITRLPGNETVIQLSNTALHDLQNTITSCIVIAALNDANNDFCELMLTLDMLKRGGIHKISIIISYLAYTRFYKQSPGVSCGINVISNVLTTFDISQIILLDVRKNDISTYFPHACFVAIESFFAEHIRSYYINLTDIILVAPDYGVAPTVNLIAQQLGCQVLQLSKDPNHNNDIMNISDIKNKRCIIIDDVIATGARIFATSSILKQCGVSEIDLYVTHFLLNTLHIPYINLLNRIVTTNSIPGAVDLYGKSKNFSIIDISDLILEHLT